MKTLNIQISELEYDKFGLRKEKLTFTEFVDIISRELMRQSLNKSVRLAGKSGLSEMSMAEISKEVKAVRKNAKSRN
jgi:hypothetical protein